jgi:quinol monooxygenase YgiN
MVTLIFSAVVKAERMEEWSEVLRWAQETTPMEDEGCISYVYYRPVWSHRMVGPPDDPHGPNPRAYVLFEQWRDQDALAAHLTRLERRFGPPPPGGGLPARILNLFEQAETTIYMQAL